MDTLTKPSRSAWSSRRLLHDRLMSSIEHCLSRFVMMCIERPCRCLPSQQDRPETLTRTVTETRQRNYRHPETVPVRLAPMGRREFATRRPLHAQDLRNCMTNPLHHDASEASLHAPRLPNKSLRRLLTFGAGVSGAAIATTVLARPSALLGRAESEPKSPESRSRGYQETAHVRSYYTTTRI
jgi:hypothetical protein